MTIAAELDARLLYLASIGDKWVTGMPQRDGDACAVMNCKWSQTTGHWVRLDGLTDSARAWLDRFTVNYDAVADCGATSATDFNDHHDRTERIWWLQEAIAAAREEGV